MCALRVCREPQVFTLLPPADVWRMGLRRYPVATYRREDGRLVPRLEDPPQEVHFPTAARYFMQIIHKRLLRLSRRS